MNEESEDCVDTCDECGQPTPSELARRTHQQNTGHQTIDLTVSGGETNGE